MNPRNSDDWDLCCFLSGGGCRKTYCEGRHEDQGDPFYENQLTRSYSCGYDRRSGQPRQGLNRVIEDEHDCMYAATDLAGGGGRNSYRKWRHEDQGAPFYENQLTRSYSCGYDRRSGRPRQYQNRVIEDEHDRMYGATDNNLNIKEGIKLLRKLQWQQESENFHLRSTHMSRSSSATSHQSSIVTSRRTSRGQSYPKIDIVKNVGVLSPRAMSKVQKQDGGVFSLNLLEELETPLKPVGRIASSLSPFAKVFIPRAGALASTDTRKGTFEGTASENLHMAKMSPVRDLVEDGPIMISSEKVWE